MGKKCETWDKIRQVVSKQTLQTETRWKTIPWYREVSGRTFILELKVLISWTGASKHFSHLLRFSVWPNSIQIAFEFALCLILFFSPSLLEKNTSSFKYNQFFQSLFFFLSEIVYLVNRYFLDTADVTMLFDVMWCLNEDDRISNMKKIS